MAVSLDLLPKPHVDRLKDEPKTSYILIESSSKKSLFNNSSMEYVEAASSDIDRYSIAHQTYRHQMRTLTFS